MKFDYYTPVDINLNGKEFWTFKFSFNLRTGEVISTPHRKVRVVIDKFVRDCYPYFDNYDIRIFYMDDDTLVSPYRSIQTVDRNQNKVLSWDVDVPRCDLFDTIEESIENKKSLIGKYVKDLEDKINNLKSYINEDIRI